MTIDGHFIQQFIAELNSRARIEGLTAYLTVLEDWHLWQALPKNLQDRAIDAVCLTLNEEFRLLGVDDYHCEQLHFRLAKFEHLTSQIVFSLLPGGEFKMGCDEHYPVEDNDYPPHMTPNESPAHNAIVRPFLMSETPVTNQHWDLGAATELSNTPVHKLQWPKDRVNWTEARQWLQQFGLRLPSEAEWEYACRAGSTGHWCFGDDPQKLDDYVYYDQHASSDQEAVKQRKHNAFGLFNMHGQVAEWCEDSLIFDYENGPYDHQARIQEHNYEKVIRGGTYYTLKRATRSTSRFGNSAKVKGGGLGFRAAKSLSI